MPNVDEIRESLDARIAQLAKEIAALNAARAALKGEGHGSPSVAPRGAVPAMVSEATAGSAAPIEVVPHAVLRAYERWDDGGRRAQSAVPWQRERWLAAIPEYGSLLRGLPDELDRAYVRRRVLDVPVTADGMVEAMVIVYAWGWSTKPVGPSRARKAFAAGVGRLGSALLAARKAMLTDGPVGGYIALAHRVDGLGPSFGTKLLYFVSPEEHRALIFDDLLSSWLRREAGLALSTQLWSRTTYERYMSSMQAWSSQLGIADDLLEEILFTEEARRRKGSAWAIPDGEA